MARRSNARKKTRDRRRSLLIPNKGREKWTLEQEMQLLRKAHDCQAHERMHYYMYNSYNIYTKVTTIAAPALSLVGVAGGLFSLVAAALKVDNMWSMIIVESILVVKALIEIINGKLDPENKTQGHYDAAITYRDINNKIQDEIATDGREREDGRVFVKDIANDMRMQEKLGPGLPWFLMKSIFDRVDLDKNKKRIESLEREFTSAAHQGGMSGSGGGSSLSLSEERLASRAPAIIPPPLPQKCASTGDLSTHLDGVSMDDSKQVVRASLGVAHAQGQQRCSVPTIAVSEIPVFQPSVPPDLEVGLKRINSNVKKSKSDEEEVDDDLDLMQEFRNTLRQKLQNKRQAENQFFQYQLERMENH